MKHSEVEPYISYAKQHGYVVVLVEPRTPWKRRPIELQAKSTHGVPLMTIRKRLEQYEEIVPNVFTLRGLYLQHIVRYSRHWPKMF